MGTRSTIAIEFADGSVSQVYCHWDGYLEHNGQILAEHYTDPFKVRDLVDLGDFSSLRETVAETAETAYSKREQEEVVFINDTPMLTGKIIKAPECLANRYQNADEYFDCSQQEEYDYILRNFEGKATWFVRCYATDGVWATIPEAKGLVERMNESECY
jgi:hypothetical protein